MLILTAQNVTGPRRGQDEKGLAKYDVWVGVNHAAIWVGSVEGHVRMAGAAALLRKIADVMDESQSDVLQVGPIETQLRRILAAPQCPKCGSQKLKCDAGCTWEIT